MPHQERDLQHQDTHLEKTERLEASFEVLRTEMISRIERLEAGLAALKKEKEGVETAPPLTKKDFPFFSKILKKIFRVVGAPLFILRDLFPRLFGFSVLLAGLGGLFYAWPLCVWLWINMLSPAVLWVAGDHLEPATKERFFTWRVRDQYMPYPWNVLSEKDRLAWINHKRKTDPEFRQKDDAYIKKFNAKMDKLMRREY